MDTQLQSLSKIFTERLFRIPDYQRGYAWQEKQLNDFWNDIMQLEDGHMHYFGVLTLERTPLKIAKSWNDDAWIIESKRYEPYFIVDGQQRITTSIIVISAIIDIIPDGEKLNYTSSFDIQRKFIFDSKDDGISRSYIFGYQKDDPSYEFLKTKIFNERSSTAMDQETVYTHNLLFAKMFFTEKLSQISKEEIEILYKKITQSLLFNIFTINEDVDVCVAFETMNNRGKPLSYLELLKNRLIYLSLKINTEETEKTHLRNAVNNTWKSIYHNLGRNKSQPLDDDQFLSVHYIMYFGVKEGIGQYRVGYRQYQNKLYFDDLLGNIFITKNLFPDQNGDTVLNLRSLYDYVSSLQDSVERWYNMFNPLSADSKFSPEIQIWMDKIMRLCGRRNYENVLPLVLATLKTLKHDKNLETFLKAIERYYFILGLCDNYSAVNIFRGLEHFNSLKAAHEMSSASGAFDKILKIIIDRTHHICSHPLFMSAIRTEFKSDGFYEWDLINYFMFEYNLSLQQKSKTDRPKIFWPEFIECPTDFISIEHIYPQQAKHSYWTSRFSAYSQKQKTIMRNSLGNLLPLSKPKNSSLSNKPFPDKRDGKDGKYIGYRYGSYAENEVASNDEWTPMEIKNRGIKLLKFMEKRWNLSLGDDDAKMQILGIDFLS